MKSQCRKTKNADDHLSELALSAFMLTHIYGNERLDGNLGKFVPETAKIELADSYVIRISLRDDSIEVKRGSSIVFMALNCRASRPVLKIVTDIEWYQKMHDLNS